MDHAAAKEIFRSLHGVEVIVTIMGDDAVLQGHVLLDGDKTILMSENHLHVLRFDDGVVYASIEPVHHRGPPPHVGPRPTPDDRGVVEVASRHHGVMRLPHRHWGTVFAALRSAKDAGTLRLCERRVAASFNIFATRSLENADDVLSASPPPRRAFGFGAHQNTGDAASISFFPLAERFKSKAVLCSRTLCTIESHSPHNDLGGPLVHAVAVGHGSCLRGFYALGMLDPRAPCRTAHRAAACGEASCLRVLLVCGIDLRAMDRHGWTPAQLAA